jgi:lipopolysaccharide/colanic/teichoic acid biosynthesis glycosyltransferase
MIRLRQILHRLIPSNRRDDSDWLLHSVDRMRAILDRERMRSDRGSATFAVLTLTLSTRCDNSDISTLARVLHDRLRATDDAGLLSGNSVGIVLPETPAEGAWKLAGDICDLLPETMRRPQCEVYVYPSEDYQTGLEADAAEAPTGAGREGRPMRALFTRPMPVGKRALDVIGATAILVVSAPVMLLVAAAIKLTSPGPVIFSQRRDTIGGEQFKIYKFRTMSVDAEQRKSALRQFSEQDGPAFKMVNDPRVTRLGRILRKTSIDELPQLFNVLKGDMSLVGPRPLPCDESSRCEPWQQRRLDVTPGLTCIWQVRGRSAVSFSEWIRMDYEYIQSRSLATDVKLILQTIPAVAFSRGAR